MYFNFFCIVIISLFCKYFFFPNPHPLLDLIGDLSNQEKSSIQSTYFSFYQSQVNLTLKDYKLLASHNSFNTRSQNYGFFGQDLRLYQLGIPIIWAQQHYSLSEQLDMGIRMLQLDPHCYASKLVLCHSGYMIPKFDKILSFLEPFTGTLEFNSNSLGCTLWDTPLEKALNEINNWIETHPKDFLIIYWNDSPFWTWHHSSKINDLIESTLNSLVIRPKDYPNPLEVPIQKFLDNDHRVLIMSENGYGAHGEQWIFRPLHSPQWPVNCINNFSRYSSQINSSSFTIFSSESQLVPFIYDGPKECGLVLPMNFPILWKQVNVVKVDQVSWKLMEEFMKFLR